MANVKELHKQLSDMIEKRNKVIWELYAKGKPANEIMHDPTVVSMHGGYMTAANVYLIIQRMNKKAQQNRTPTKMINKSLDHTLFEV